MIVNRVKECVIVCGVIGRVEGVIGCVEGVVYLGILHFFDG